MDVEICRKCGHWSEFVALMDDFAVVACCCSRFNISHDHVVSDMEGIASVRAALSRHGRRKCATFKAKEFPMIAWDACGEWYSGIVGKIAAREPPKGCPYLTEHMISGWSKVE